MATTTIHVIGMTCSHCVAAVSSEIQRLPGVRAVDVELATGEVTITSDGPLTPDALREAVDEAGYEIAPR